MIRAARLLLYFALGLLLGAVSVSSFAVSANTSGAWANVGTSPTWTGAAGASHAGTVSTIETIKVGNTYIPVPTTGTIGGAVASTMVSAIRSAPQAMLGGLLLQYLLSKGLELIDGEWKKKQSASFQYPSGGTGWTVDYSTPSADTPLGACHSWIQGHYGVQGTCTPNGLTESTTLQSVGYHWENGRGNYGELYARNPQGACPAGSSFSSNTGLCELPESYVPAGESDWDQVRGVLPPDAVMDDVCKRLFALDGIGCRVTGLGTKTAVAPISDSYTDGTGTKWSQTPKWVPQPTAADPLAGIVQMLKTALTQAGTVQNADGSTTTTTVDPDTGKIKTVTTYLDGKQEVTTKDPETGSKTTTTPDGQTKTETPDKDLCVQHPDSIGCSEFGEVGDVDLEKDNRNISITPDMSFGPLNGTCPADLTKSLSIGVEARFSYQPLCQMANTFRPIVIGMAWVSAALLMFGIGRKGD